MEHPESTVLLIELLIGQLDEAYAILEDIDDAGEGRGIVKAALKTAAKLLEAGETMKKQP